MLLIWLNLRMDLHRSAPFCQGGTGKVQRALILTVDFGVLLAAESSEICNLILDMIAGSGPVTISGVALASPSSAFRFCAGYCWNKSTWEVRVALAEVMNRSNPDIDRHSYHNESLPVPAPTRGTNLKHWYRICLVWTAWICLVWTA